MKFFVAVRPSGITIAASKEHSLRKEFVRQRDLPLAKQFMQTLMNSLHSFKATRTANDALSTLEDEREQEMPLPVKPLKEEDALRRALQELEAAATFTVDLCDVTRSRLYAISLLITLPEDHESRMACLAQQKEMLDRLTAEQRIMHECNSLELLLNEIRWQQEHDVDFWHHVRILIDRDKGSAHFLNLKPVQEFLIAFFNKIEELTRLH